MYIVVNLYGLELLRIEYDRVDFSLVVYLIKYGAEYIIGYVRLDNNYSFRVVES